MTTAARHPLDQIESLAASFRHVREEHRGKQPESSVRRRLGDDVQDLEARVETLLTQWVPDPDQRRAWRAHVYEGEAPPADDLERRPPVFKGQAESGSRIEVRPQEDGRYDAVIDGRPADRLPADVRFSAGPLPIAGQDWRETTDAPPEALSALRRYVSGEDGQPPWEWARPLFTEGIIDVNFGLTDRGRRILES
jgi:hypothetical protein